MTIICEKTLGWTWKGWSGGKDTLDELTADEVEMLEIELQELFPDGINETELNDFLWFERDQVAEMLAFNDWEDLMEQRDRKNTPTNHKRAEHDNLHSDRK